MRVSVDIDAADTIRRGRATLDGDWTARCTATKLMRYTKEKEVEDWAGYIARTWECSLVQLLPAWKRHLPAHLGSTKRFGGKAHIKAT